MEYCDKTKDQTVFKILTLYNKLSERDITTLKFGMIFIPSLILYFSSHLIESNTILTMIGINIFSVLSIIYAVNILIEILNKDTGSESMIEIADAIKEGSEGFFVTQYSTILKLSLVFGIGIFFLFQRLDLI